MKPSELRKHIRETIISELSETTMVGPKTNPNKAQDIAKDEKTDVNTVKTAINKARQNNMPVSVAENEVDEITVNQPGLKTYIIIPDGDNFYSQIQTKASSVKEIRKVLEDDKMEFTDKEWRKVIIIEGKYVQNGLF